VDTFSKEMELDIDVFDSLVKGGVLREINGSVVVAEDRGRCSWCEIDARQ
jgi:hypothetical protein